MMMMFNLVYRGIEKIVNTGVDGTILILPLAVLVWVIIGQAKDCIRVARKVLGEGVKEGRS